MVYRLVVFICIVITVAACKKSQKIPSNILSQQKMQAVVWDMMRADQYLGDFVFPRDTSLVKDSESIHYYQQVLAIHKLSKEQFTRSWKYYNEHPALMQAIMDSIGKMPVSNFTPPITPTADTDYSAKPGQNTVDLMPGQTILIDSLRKKKNKKNLEVQ